MKEHHARDIATKKINTDIMVYNASNLNGILTPV